MAAGCQRGEGIHVVREEGAQWVGLTFYQSLRGEVSILLVTSPHKWELSI
jgi:hypothetical protein